METQTKPTTAISVFEGTLDRYKQAITNLLGSKYGITPLELMVKAINAVKKNPELLKCTPQSLYGSILYFAEVGLPFGEGPGPTEVGLNIASGRPDSPRKQDLQRLTQYLPMIEYAANQEGAPITLNNFVKYLRSL